MTRMMRLSPEQYDTLVASRKKHGKAKPALAALDAGYVPSIPVTPCPTKGPSSPVSDRHEKYRNRPIGGYASRKEARRAKELKLMDHAGEINHLEEQVPFTLIPAQYDDNRRCLERKCTYVADFVYQLPNGAIVVEDVKGYRDGQAYALFVVKRKLMLQVHKIRIKEV